MTSSPSSPPHTRLFRSTGADRVALVSAQPAHGKPGFLHLLVARGPTARSLGKASLYGPFADEEAGARLGEIVEGLKREGFRDAGHEAVVQALESGSIAQRTRAGWRLARLARGPSSGVPQGDVAAGDALLRAAEAAGPQVSPFVDALGLLGDPRAIPLARAEAERKLLSRRRSGIEALRNLGDAEGLAAATERSRERLPDGVRSRLGTGAAPLAQQLLALAPKDRGLALDSLYELGSEESVEAVRLAIPKLPVGEPWLWRYAKSVFKRSLLRRDHETFGLLAVAIERAGRTSWGTKAELKSGLDGAVRETRVFSRATQGYMRRLAWRHLRALARYRPDEYARAAAEAVVPYGPEDLGEPKGLSGALASCYVLNRVLFGASARLRLDGRSLRHRFVSSKTPKRPEGVREELYPELWDRDPRAHVRILSAARLWDAQDFAVAAVRRNPRLLENATPSELVGLLAAPHEDTVAFGVSELSRRFDPEGPDLDLLQSLLQDGRPVVAALCRSWLEATATSWTADEDRLVAFLLARDGGVRADVVRLAAAAMERTGSTARAELARRVLELLRDPEPFDGAHEGPALLALACLVPELGAFVRLDEVMAGLATGSQASRELFAALLGQSHEAADEIVGDRLVSLAGHEMVAIRQAAHTLAERILPRLAAEPYPLLAMAESEWPDTREAAVRLLRLLDGRRLPREAVLALVDSSAAEAQELGRELILRRLTEFPRADLVERLSEHPDARVRRFALELMLRFGGDESVPLVRLERFLRAALFSVRPDGLVKRKVLEMLVSRGTRDAADATVAATVLGELLGTSARQDFERVLGALVRIRLAFPAVAMPVVLSGPPREARA